MHARTHRITLIENQLYWWTVRVKESAVKTHLLRSTFHYFVMRSRTQAYSSFSFRKIDITYYCLVKDKWTRVIENTWEMVFVYSYIENKCREEKNKCIFMLNLQIQQTPHKMEHLLILLRFFSNNWVKIECQVMFSTRSTPLVNDREKKN